jgi:hypothetical protein
VKQPSLLTAVVAILGAGFLGCLGLIGALSVIGDRPIPDVLVGTTTGILGLLGGILVPSKSDPVGGTLNIYREAGEHRREAGRADVLYILLVVLVVLVILALLGAL